MTRSIGPARRLWRGLTGRGSGGGDKQLSSYSQLAYRLENDLSMHERGRSVLLAATEECRITVEATAELAWHLAEELGQEILMVDGSFRADGMTSVLGGDGTGLMDLLGSRDLDLESVRAAQSPTKHPSIRFLPGGHGDNGRLVAARADVLRRFLTLSTQLADFVLIQGSGVLNAGRSLAFGGVVDAVLLVAVEDETRLEEVERSRHVLGSCGAERVGLVLANRKSRPRRSFL